MGECVICHRSSAEISESLGLCARCILGDTAAARAQAAAAHCRSRRRFALPTEPPHAVHGLRCGQCVNRCRIAEGQVGYCGVRGNVASPGETSGRGAEDRLPLGDEGGPHADGPAEMLRGGDADAAAVQWYFDALPTNCVADWVCPASGPAGYPRFTHTKGPERGGCNLAVFYEACSFDCLFCQNWHFREHSLRGPRHSAGELVEAVTRETRCICFFGGDPSCQMAHALAAAREARAARGRGILRICWETNASMSRSAAQQMAQLSLQSGGCIKVDLKAFDQPLHRALCGVSNQRSLKNFEYLSRWSPRRPDPPFLIASTLLVPGYVDARQVEKIAAFLAALDPEIPYSLLAFHPAFEMRDLPVTPRRLADECLAAARSAGLRRVRVGNEHLLDRAD